MGRGSLVQQIRVITIAVVAIAAIHVGVARPAWACGCCACDFGGSEVECGSGDPDCGLCIALGGQPAADCSICAGFKECADETLCAGDPSECSTDVTGSCCVASLGPFAHSGMEGNLAQCIEVTALGCNTVDGAYNGDGSTCAEFPCLPTGASCSVGADCTSTFCADGVCCNEACTEPGQQCNLAGSVGQCSNVAAAAPALSPIALALVAVVLAAVALLAIRRRA